MKLKGKFAISWLLALGSWFIFTGLHAASNVSNNVPNIIEPVQLNVDTTVLYLNDFFIEPGVIDSVSFSLVYAGTWNREAQTLQLVTATRIPALTDVTLWSAGEGVSIVLKKSPKRKYDFKFDPKGKTYQSVQLTGEMNDWDPNESNFTFDGGVWRLSMALNPGAYRYQLVADGKRMSDPANPDSVSNNDGSANSLFKAPGIPGRVPHLTTIEYSSNKIKIRTQNRCQKILIYWQNRQTGIVQNIDDGTNFWADIPEEATALQRSYIRVYAYNEYGSGNDVLVPLQYGQVLTNAQDLNRADKEAQIIYSVFVDRFFDGDSANDKPVIFDSLKPQANFYGGDLAGITQKINSAYFDSLHVNTLWISPILQNPRGAYKEYSEPHNWYSGYHGYWPISLTKIDYRFGDDAVFKKLVDEAHRHQFNVLVDLVANRVHEECPIYKKHPEWATPLMLPGGRKNIQLWHEYPLTTWFDAFLPTWDFTKKEVVKLEVDSALLWISKFNIDGFSYDATKYIAATFRRSLTLNIKKIDIEKHQNFYQLGETYGSKELVASYLGGGLLNGQLDFNLYFDARAAFAKDGEGFEKLASTLQQSLDFYGEHNLMGNITGNDNLPRFASLAGGGLSFDEDARKAAWDKTVTMGSNVAYSKLANMVAFIATIPGVPVIYYGDEIGMPGAGDPDNRRMMRFSNLSAKELELKAKVSQLFQLRQQHLSLIYGDFKLLQVGDHLLIYERNYFNETTLVAFNNSPQAITINLNDADGPAGRKFVPQFGGQLNEHTDASTGVNRLNFVLPGESFEVFVASQ